MTTRAAHATALEKENAALREEVAQLKAAVTTERRKKLNFAEQLCISKTSELDALEDMKRILSSVSGKKDDENDEICARARRHVEELRARVEAERREMNV